MHKRALQMLFAFILVSLTAYNGWVSTRQPVWEWGGLTTPPDNLWTIATLIDAYYGFVTFYLWVLWKEVRVLPRVMWFVAIMLLGNIAMSAYVLRQLARLTPADSMHTLLAARNA
jgi:gamma-glutamylcysteine synthetase